MKTTTKILLMGLISTIATFLQNCTSSWNEFHAGTWEGKKYVVQTREIKGGFTSTNSIEYRIRWGELPYLTVNAETTDWGVVYSTDIFEQAPFDFITSKNIAYCPEIEKPVGARTFLYLSPKEISKPEYETYTRFFKSAEWQKTDSLIVDGEPGGFPHIVGVVHGIPLSFVKNFRGLYSGQESIFRIENDGRVRLVDPGERSETGTGMSIKVEMPGKVIYFSTEPGAFGVEDLKGFKNEQGQTPMEVFRFLPKEGEGF